MLHPVSSPHLPPPLGHYALAIAHDSLLYVSATLPLAPDGAITPASPFVLQMQQLLANCAAVLAAAGSSVARVVSFTLYLTELAQWDQADAMLAAFFGAHRPARAVLGVAQIRKGYAVQASLIAAA